jgi:hypothetical protein
MIPDHGLRRKSEFQPRDPRACDNDL